MKVAFVMLKSPQESDPFGTMSRICGKEDACAILFEDAVYNALSEERANKLSATAAEVLVASDDMEARGFTSSDLKVGKAVTYEDIVDCIMERTERTVTL